MTTTPRVSETAEIERTQRVATNGTTPDFVTGDPWGNSWGATWGRTWGRLFHEAIIASPVNATTSRVSAAASGGLTKRV
jgi:hypothetical protein